MYLIKQIHTLFLTGLFTVLVAISAFAGIVFDGSPGTNAPPATLGGLTMDPFPADGRPLNGNVTDVPINSSGSPVIGFSNALSHTRIGIGWATWSHGYTGDVYVRPGNTLTINLPANTRAFYLYIEGNSFGTANIMATANDGTSSGLIPVVGNSGATYYGFYTTSSACLLTSIVIQADQAAQGFAVGEFGINIMACTDVMACKDINVSLDAPGFDPGSGVDGQILSTLVQPDGKILIGGIFYSYNGTPRNGIARVNPDGSLDLSFDTGIKLTHSGIAGQVYTLALQPNGKILIGGLFDDYNGTPRNGIARLNPDGSLDTGFNPGSGVGGLIYSLALQPDGKILIGGGFSSYNGTPRRNIARLNPDGNLDLSFDPGSGVTGGSEFIQSLALQPDGKILIVGNFTKYNGISRNGIARINPDGSLDLSFNPGSGVNIEIFSTVIQPDGKILIGGRFTEYNGTPRNGIARLNPDGSLDLSFDPGSGVNGIVWTTALQPDGKILIGGQFTGYNGISRNAIARLKPNGSLDLSFDPGSGVNFLVPGCCVFSLGLQADGKILVGGLFTDYNGTPRNSIALLLKDGSLVGTGGSCQATITPEMLLTGGICLFDKVVELSHYNQPVSNPVGIEYLGKTIIGKVTDTLTGNSCWSEILIEDKLAPEIICRPLEVSCKEFELEHLHPVASNDCSNFTVKLLDEQIENLACDTSYIKRVVRRWVSVDAQGNESAPCEQEIKVHRINIYGTVFPKDSLIKCEDIKKTDANGHPHPDITGVPTLDGWALWPTENFNCNVAVEYEDLDLGEIGCVRKIMRTWRIREWWCNQENENFRTQLIQVRDITGPVITHSPYDFEATTGHRSCEASVLLPRIEARDACHNDLRVDIAYPGGVLVDQNGGRVNLPVGLDTIVYRVYDGCYNVTTDTLLVWVRDRTEPVAVCDRRTVVSLNDSGENLVPAEVFDDGSFDECGLHHFEVRRMDSNPCDTNRVDDWGVDVKFCCVDVGKDTIMVAFKAIDLSGNEAVCMVMVEVQDKDMPRIICPPDIEVDCRFDYDSSKLGRSFGKVVTQESARDQIVIDTAYWHKFHGHPQDGIAYDNCSPTVTERIDTSASSLNQCGMGVIVREFTVTDGQGNSATCVQRIEIANHRPVKSLSIDWPDDFDTTGVCDSKKLIPELLKAPYKVPVVKDDECSMLGMDYTDHVFSATVPGEPCFKIFRVWKVIDWCYRDSLGDIVIYQDTQIIKVNNVMDPVITRVCRDTTICTYDIECRPIAVVLSIGATDDCTASSELMYRYKIDLDSDGTIDIVRTSIGDSTARGTWPLGRHTIKWEVEDRCGNIAKCESKLNLLNCKPPAAFCHRNLSITLTALDTTKPGDGVPDIKWAEVWAGDLNVNSGHSCGYPVKFSFSADTADKVRYYTCDSIGRGKDVDIVNVEMWVTDINGNQSFCRTEIVIVDDTTTAPLCRSRTFQSVVVSGLVRTEGNREVENAEVKLEQSILGSVKTSYEGAYRFAPMNSGGSYTVRPEKNDDWTNGVTTADIVRIQRHILGLEPIISPYKMIAADVNRTKSITARDILDLRKLILGMTQEIPGNRSWRFVPVSHSFGSPEEALEEQYPEEYNIPQLASDIQSDFVAVKVGDVNESARTRGYQEVNSRTGRTLDLYYEDVQMKRGEVYEIELKSTNISLFAGFQTTLELQSGTVQLLDVIPHRENRFEEDHYSLHATAAGLIPVSWDGSARDDERLLTIKVRALGDLRVSEVLGTGSQITQSLSVGQLSEEGRVELRGTGQLKKEFVLLQNEPNPWKEQTNIGLVLPEAGTVRLTIYDVTGRVYFRGEREFGKGYQEWILGQDLLENTGVYYYQADFGSNTQTRKMVVMD